MVKVSWRWEVLDKAKWCFKWPAISQESLCLMAPRCGYVKAEGYEVIPRASCYPAVPQVFPWHVSISPDDIVPRRAEKHIQKQCPAHQVGVKWFPSLPQSADLNIAGLLWSVLERRAWCGFLPPSSLKAFLLQWRVNIQLPTEHNLWGSTPWGTGSPPKGGPISLLVTWCSNTVKDFCSLKNIFKNIFYNPETLFRNPFWNNDSWF